MRSALGYLVLLLAAGIVAVTLWRRFRPIRRRGMRITVDKTDDQDRPEEPEPKNLTADPLDE